MKCRHLLLTGGAAVLSYWAVTNREKIAQEASETAALLTESKEQYQAFQDALARIQSYQEPLKEIVADLTYQTRVYQQSIAGNLQAIKSIQEKKETPSDE